MCVWLITSSNTLQYAHLKKLCPVTQAHNATRSQLRLWSRKTEYHGANKHMASNQIDIADLDCIYLSYDEPEKEEFWIKIKNMVPWARRVDGVKIANKSQRL
jgi:hypothetical protein